MSGTGPPSKVAMKAAVKCDHCKQPLIGAPIDSFCYGCGHFICSMCDQLGKGTTWRSHTLEEHLYADEEFDDER